MPKRRRRFRIFAPKSPFFLESLPSQRLGFFIIKNPQPIDRGYVFVLIGEVLLDVEPSARESIHDLAANIVVNVATF